VSRISPFTVIDYKKYWSQSKNVNHIPKDYGKLSFQIIRDFLNQDAIFYVKGIQKLNITVKGEMRDTEF